MRQEDLVPITIQPTSGMYGYLLVHPLDFELFGQGLFSFRDPKKAAQDQIVTVLTQNLLQKHGFEGRDRGREVEREKMTDWLELEFIVFICIQVMVLIVKKKFLLIKSNI